MEKRKKIFIALAVLFGAMSWGNTHAQQTSGEEIDWSKDFTSRITLNGYAQAGYSWETVNGVHRNDFNLKRTLLWAKARITDRWSFLFMHDFSSVVQEYYTDYRISNNKALTFRLGQFKHSFSMENPLSPTMLELIDVYSQAVLYLAGEGPDPLNGVNYGRDLGAMIYGDLANNMLHYELALMNGQGINRRDGNNLKDFIGKLELRPMNGLRLVVSGQKGVGHAVGQALWNPEIQYGEDYTRDRFSVGAEWKTGSYAPGKYKEARPISIRTEWLGGKDGNVSSQGGYLTVCVPIQNGIDVIASADVFNRNTSVEGWQQSNFTAGLQYWFYKKCRLQMQYTHTLNGQRLGSDRDIFQTQFQVAF